MTLKEKIENNLVIFTLGLLFTGFLSGFGAYKAIQEIGGLSKPSDMTNWEPTARASGWIPSTECPAFPVSVALTNPGNHTIIDVSDIYLYTDLVIQCTRSLPLGNSVGFIINQKGDSNFYISHRLYFEPDESRKVFRVTEPVHLPFKPRPGSTITMWAYIATDIYKVGTVYNSISQIKQASPEIVLSESVTLSLKQHIQN
jgi:hypothetical protein